MFDLTAPAPLRQWCVAVKRGCIQDATYANAIVAEHPHTATVQRLVSRRSQSHDFSGSRQTPEGFLRTFLPEYGHAYTVITMIRLRVRIRPLRLVA